MRGTRNPCAPRCLNAARNGVHNKPPYKTDGVGNMYIKAVAHISQVRGGSQARIMLADDGKKYVTKLMGNPQCTRVLANDYLASRLARMIGLSVPEPVIILVDEDNPSAANYLHPGWTSGCCASGGSVWFCLSRRRGPRLAARNTAWTGQELEGVCRSARL